MHALVLQEVRQIIADYLNIDIDTVYPSANLCYDLSIDSLDLVELTVLFQHRFNCQAQGSLPYVQTVEEVATLLVSMESSPVTLVPGSARRRPGLVPSPTENLRQIS